MQDAPSKTRVVECAFCGSPTATTHNICVHCQKPLTGKERRYKLKVKKSFSIQDWLKPLAVVYGLLFLLMLTNAHLAIFSGLIMTALTALLVMLIYRQ